MSAAARRAPQEIELPERIQITPSRINIWRGAKKAGARFTHSQIAQLAALGRDTCIQSLAKIEAVSCRSNVGWQEAWWPQGEPRPVYVFECPLMETLANGDRIVISPSGAFAIIHPDGSLGRDLRPPASIGGRR